MPTPVADGVDRGNDRPIVAPGPTKSYLVLSRKRGFRHLVGEVRHQCGAL
jgi:hypothetical protein